MKLARSKGADRTLAEQLERIALKQKDLEALSVAHDLIARELGGVERAAELVRQAEARASAGVDALEAQQHGEVGLQTVPAAQVEPLLARLASLTASSGPFIDVYERQIGRCKVPAERLAALSRAAQVAVVRGAPERAKSFYEIAIASGAAEETLLALELSASQGDRDQGGTTLRETLADALSAGGQGARDGGRTRGFLLRRAAHIAQRDLGDVEKAFSWLGEALIAHVDPATLDALEELATEVGDLTRSEAALGRALAEVFDGPLVRQLLARRVKLRREKLEQPHRGCRRPEEVARSVACRRGGDGRALVAAHRAWRFPGHGARARRSDLARQRPAVARRARPQGGAALGRAAQRSARGSRCLASGAAHEAGRSPMPNRGSNGPRPTC